MMTSSRALTPSHMKLKIITRHRMRKKRYLPTSTTTYSGSDKEQTAESGLLPNRNHLDTMLRPRGHSNDLYRIARAPLLLCCLLRFGGCLGFSPWIPRGASTVVRHRLAAASGDGAAATTQTVDLSSGTLAEVMSLVPPASSSQGRSPLFLSTVRSTPRGAGPRTILSISNLWAILALPSVYEALGEPSLGTG